jgi:phosphosulfolactate synthase
MADFLDLPERSVKPRERGITHVLDRGLSLAEVDGLVEVAGGSVDVVKLGWGTAIATANLIPKLERYRHHGIPVVVGGTLTEAAIRQRRIEPFIEWLHAHDLRHIEISDGTIAIEPSYKRELITRLSKEFVVFSEVGSKDAEEIMAPYRWVEEIQAELEAGAWKVIAEARESGNAGIYRPDGELRMGLIDEIAHAIDPAKMIFEAPRKSQQVWFLRRFGPDCNLGNIAPADVLSLETLRLGLRSDTMLDLAPGPDDDTPPDQGAPGGAAQR